MNTYIRMVDHSGILSPVPALPMTKTECRTWISSSSCTTFKTKWSSAWRPKSWGRQGKKGQE